MIGITQSGGSQLITGSPAEAAHLPLGCEYLHKDRHSLRARPTIAGSWGTDSERKNNATGCGGCAAVKRVSCRHIGVSHEVSSAVSQSVPQKVPFPLQLETNPVKPIRNWPDTGR
jgi:hypothetical protein